MFETLKQNLHARPLLWASVFVGFLALCRLIFISAGPLDLAPDEAQYWDWSRHLDWGYYSKPPLIAWLIAASTSVFGSTELGVRFPAVLGQAGIFLIIFTLLKNWRGLIWAWLGLISIQLVPLISAGGILMTTDIPCAFFWLLAIYILSKVNWAENGQWKLFIALGFAIGLGGLSKLTAGAFYPLLAAYILFDKQRRPWLLKPQVYVSGTISLVSLTPMLWWNSQNNWVSFRHVLGQATGDSTFAPLANWGELMLSQLGVWGLVAFPLIGLYWVMQRARVRGGSDFGELLWWFSAPLFVVFLWKGMDAKIQANWPLLAVLTGYVGMFGWLAMQHKIVKWIFFIGLIPSLLLTTVTYNTNFVRDLGLKLKVKIDPHKPMLGWQELGALLGGVLNAMPEITAVFTTRYQTASSIAFYTTQQPKAHYINPGYRRLNQYDLWAWPALTANSTVLYVNEQNKLEPAIANGFIQCTTGPQLEGRAHGLVYKKLFTFICSGYKGLERTHVHSY